MSRHVKRIDELAKNIPPPRDLWPGIAAAIEADRAAGAPAQKPAGRRPFWMPAAGLAASVLLVTVGVFLGRIIGTGQPPGQDPVAINPQPQPEWAVRNANYEKQRDALLVEAGDKLKTMAPADREKVAASLATLRKSIKEIEAALGQDPANALLQELFVSSCQEEMRALTTVRDSGREEI
jgi:hypothetical protein